MYDDGKKHSGLTNDELALTSAASITIVSVKGEINQVLALNSAATLKNFFEVIKKIKLPEEFIQRAKKLNIPPYEHVKNLSTLLQKNILTPDWRRMPMLYDIPANSQILGQIAQAAGIEPILYPSKMSSTKNCLAVFPNNFSQSASFVEIEGESPCEVKYKRLDSQTYMNAI